MPRRYQEIYPSPPLLDSASIARDTAASLMTLEYFQSDPADMPEHAFAEHHVLLNLNETPQRVQNWRDGRLHEFTFQKDEIVVTPAGVRSGWRWFARSDVIVVTLDPARVRAFAEKEIGLLLTDQQLRDLPVFKDADICAAGVMLRDALKTNDLASVVMFESLSRVFLIKLLQRYGDQRAEDLALSKKFTVAHYRRVLDYIRSMIAETIVLEDLAREVGMSPSHFSRVFKETLGKSPIQYVMAYRIEQAAKLMADPQLPLVEVALRCGFADQAHFSRSFKNLIGKTPRDYRATMSV